MTYYEHFDDIFDGEPLPEDLIESSFDEDGNLRFDVRMMLIMELAGMFRIACGGIISPAIRDRIAGLWATDRDDYANVRSDMDMFLSFVEGLEEGAA